MNHTLTYKRSPRYEDYQDRHRKGGYQSGVISEDVFLKCSQKDCHYCGVAGPNGLDRVDCTKGYEVGNCVPCCKHCNYVKGNLSFADFETWTERFVAHQSKVKANGQQDGAANRSQPSEPGTSQPPVAAGSGG